jgi:hypothetical protein
LVLLGIVLSGPSTTRPRDNPIVEVVKRAESEGLARMTNYPLTIAINTFKSEYSVDEPVPLAVAIANMSTDVVYVAKIQLSDTGNEPYVVVKTEDKEIPARGRGLQPLPLCYFMDRGEKRVQMLPVWRLAAMDGMVFIIADALKPHRGRLTNGTYTLALQREHLTAYDDQRVVRREGLPHDLWVEAREPYRSVKVKPNTITIEISQE